MKKISIIITLYNRSHLIQRALDSALNQDYSDKEIIIIDDGSTDNPYTILERYINSGQVDYFYQKNFGAAAAKNRGAELACGQYLVFLDSDDYFQTNQCLSKVAKLINAHDVDFICFDGIFIKQKNKEFIQKIKLSGIELCDYVFRYPLNYPGKPPYFFNRSLFLTSYGFNENFKWGDAMLFWRVFLPLCDQIMIVNGSDYVYDQTELTGISRNRGEKYYDRVLETLETTYMIIYQTLKEKKYRERWELIMLGVCFKGRIWSKFFSYIFILLKRNPIRVLNSILYIISRRLNRG